MSDDGLEGKAAFITGGARGIGAESAALLGERGCLVFVTDILGEKAKETAARICDAGGRAEGMEMDVTREDSWEEATTRARDWWGGEDVGVLLNNAGVFGELTRLEDLTLEGWRRTLRVNLDGVFLGCRWAMRAMKGGGSVINVSSILGLRGGKKTADYCASKGGVKLLTKAAALEGGPVGIRVNSIHPGYIDTDMTREGIGRLVGDLGAAQEHIRGLTALKRLGEPRDMAKVVVFLAGSGSSYMTGCEVVADGGITVSA